MCQSFWNFWVKEEFCHENSIGSCILLIGGSEYHLWREAIVCTPVQGNANLIDMPSLFARPGLYIKYRCPILACLCFQLQDYNCCKNATISWSSIRPGFKLDQLVQEFILIYPRWGLYSDLWVRKLLSQPCSFWLNIKFIKLWITVGISPVFRT